jgi:TIR domain
MDTIKQILAEIKKGKKKFLPASNSKEDMEDFQAIAKLLIGADKEGLLDNIKVHQESRTTNSWYDLIFVQNGLSHAGELYLENEQNVCPVCKIDTQDVNIWDYGERISLECGRCGKFTITRTASTMIGRKDLDYKFSAWIRQQQANDVVPEIDSSVVKRLELELPTYKVADKQLILLKCFGQSAEYDGKPFDVITPYDIPLAWAKDEKEFEYILRLLIERNLIRRLDGPPDLSDSFAFKFEITADGWLLLEKEVSPMENRNEKAAYDIFISHASEDKDSIARPLYEELKNKGVSVWFDEAVLSLGDTLRRKIDEGLSKCKYGVVILSPSFLSKEWPQRELDGLVARETASGKKAILPIWHDIDHDTVLRYSPTLADKLAGNSKEGLQIIVAKILEVLK